MALLLALAAPLPAGAVTLAFTGNLRLYMAGLQSIPPLDVPGTGVVTANGSGPGGHLSSLAIPASPFAATDYGVPVTDPNVFPIAGLGVTLHNGAGTVAGGAGVIPIPGVAKVCLYFSCHATPVANLTVPLGVVGVGGVATAIGGAGPNLTVIGAPWTTGTAAIGTLTAMGFAKGPLGLASSTAQPSGQLQLVTPIFVSSSIGSFPVWPFFAVMTLHFVPEPATMALLGGGLVALAAAARRRLRAH